MSEASSAALPMPESGRLAGVDFGTRRIGVATCDPSRKFCGPYEVYERCTQALDAAWFQKLVKEEGLVGFVVGLPLHVSGDESRKSLEAREFAKWLHETTGLPVDLHDERYTSHAAEHMLAGTELTKKRRKARIDALAAQMILESYLQRNG
jgi:putative Holliday junction resolvase